MVSELIWNPKPCFHILSLNHRCPLRSGVFTVGTSPLRQLTTSNTSPTPWYVRIAAEPSTSPIPCSTIVVISSVIPTTATAVFFSDQLPPQTIVPMINLVFSLDLGSFTSRAPGFQFPPPLTVAMYRSSVSWPPSQPMFPFLVTHTTPMNMVLLLSTSTHRLNSWKPSSCSRRLCRLHPMPWCILVCRPQTCGPLVSPITSPPNLDRLKTISLGKLSLSPSWSLPNWSATSMV